MIRKINKTLYLNWDDTLAAIFEANLIPNQKNSPFILCLSARLTNAYFYSTLARQTAHKCLKMEGKEVVHDISI